MAEMMIEQTSTRKCRRGFRSKYNMDRIEIIFANKIHEK